MAISLQEIKEFEFRLAYKVHNFVYVTVRMCYACSASLNNESSHLFHKHICGNDATIHEI